MNFRLTRFERLSGRKKIEHLFIKGKTFHSQGMKITWLFSEEENRFPVKVMFTAPKRKFKKAVTRNRLKRLMREGYRKNKQELYQFLEGNPKILHLSILFTGDAAISSSETESKIILTLQRLIKEITLNENTKS